MTKYLIDTNSLIDAKEFFYAFDICPGFWNGLVRHHVRGDVFSIDRVRDEIVDGNDRLVRWAKKMPKGFFVTSSTNDIAVQYSQIIQWVEASFHRQDAVASFAAKADGWPIATAKEEGYTIVCEEQFNPAAQKRVPNPNVCKQFGVPYCNVYQMLRQLKIQLGLKKLVSDSSC